MCCCTRNCDQQDVKSKIPTHTGEGGYFSWKGYTHFSSFMVWSIPHATTHCCLQGCTKHTGPNFKITLPKQMNWAAQRETSQNNALSQSRCHETALPERCSMVKGCKRNTAKSEKYKVEVESLKPAQECQIKNSSLIFLPTEFSSITRLCESIHTVSIPFQNSKFLSTFATSFP